MRFSIRALLVAALAAALITPAAAQTIQTPAKHAVIMDYDTGEILYDKDGDAPMAPASMSKLMTVAIVFDKLEKGELSLDDEFYVSEKAWRMQGSKMWTRVNTKIPLFDLLQGIIVQSGNDACVVVAEHISGTEDAFADLMNKKAQEWGLKNSTFANATGWPDPNQKMSAVDLAKLARKIIHDYPEYYKYFSEREFTWENIRQSNRNPILGEVPGADGLKTGHTEESGYGLVGSAVQDGERRILVINGLDSMKQRSQETQRMMRIAFNAFETKELFKAGDLVGDALVFKGVSNAVPLLVKNEVKLTVPRGAADAVKATMVYTGPIKAPVSANQQIGYLRVEAPNRDAKEYPLFAARGVEETGFVGKLTIGVERLLGIENPLPPEPADTSVAGK